MKQLLFTTLFILSTFYGIGQDWSGFYAFTVDKKTEDGQPYKAKIDMQIYKLHGDYWGEMRASGNPNFGTSWSVEFWVLDNGNSLYCYYNKGNDEFYKTNALVFSLEGSPSNFTTVFGPSTMNAIQFLETNPGFKFVSKKADVSSEIYTAPTTTTPASITKTEPKTTTPSKTTRTSKFDLILGKWSGKAVNDLYKFHDYEFKIDGSGTQNGETIEWEMVEEAGMSYIKITSSKRIARSEYQEIMAKASSLEGLDTYTLVKTPEGTFKLRIEGEKYFLVQSPKTLQVNKVNSTTLTLSVRTKGAKWKKTKHSRVQ